MKASVKIISKKYPQRGSQIVSQEVWGKMQNNGTANNFRVIDSNVTEAVKVPEEVKETLEQAKEPVVEGAIADQNLTEEITASAEPGKKTVKKDKNS